MDNDSRGHSKSTFCLYTCANTQVLTLATQHTRKAGERNPRRIEPRKSVTVQGAEEENCLSAVVEKEKQKSSCQPFIQTRSSQSTMSEFPEYPTQGSAEGLKDLGQSGFHNLLLRLAPLVLGSWV